MSVGFNNIITFSNNGKISDYQKAYDNNYGKIIKTYLPLHINNKKDYEAILSVSINNTFPKQIEIVKGYKNETDLNCYIFDVSELYRKYYENKKLGLTRLKLMCDNGRVKFISESFRL